MIKTLRTILIDDEEFCRNDLSEALRKIPHVEITAEASNLKDAVFLIRKHSPDLVFLDLNLNGENGFKVLSQAQEIPSVIAVTAFSEHAVDGFRQGLTDYILKPVDETRLRLAIDRSRKELLLKSVKAPLLLEMEIKGKTTTIPLKDIYALKSNENYVEVHSTIGIGLIRSTFTRLVERFPSGLTLEISRGHVLVRHQINGWQRDEGGRLLITIKNGQEFVVAKRLHKEVLQHLEEFF
jgi:two-component system LytT family response regulator